MLSEASVRPGSGGQSALASQPEGGTVITAQAPDPALELLARTAAVAAGGLDPDLLADFLPTVLALVRDHSRVRRDDLRRFADAGRSAARRGVALRALVELYLSSAWRLWPQLPEVQGAGSDPAGVVRAGETVLRACDEAVAALAEGYQLARREVMREQATARREFVDDLLIGGARTGVGMIDRAAFYGLRLAGPQAVVVVTAARPFADGSSVTRTIERSLHGAKADADPFVTTKDGSLVVIFAAPDRAAVDEVRSRLVSQLPAAPGGSGAANVRLERIAPVGEWRLAIGRPHPGPDGVRMSYEDARDAFRFARRLRSHQQILDASDLLLHRVLARDEGALRELVADVLGPLVAARGGAEPLLATLEAYFGAAGNASAAARDMHLSVRALTYRLDRIRTLTGRDLADPAGRLELQTSVLGARLIGWPGSPRPVPR